MLASKNIIEAYHEPGAILNGESLLQISALQVEKYGFSWNNFNETASAFFFYSTKNDIIFSLSGK